MNAHIPNGCTAADPHLAGHWIGSLSMDRLKREIDVAVWNWEVRRGLEHYNGDRSGFRGVIERAARVGKAERRARREAA